MEKAKGWCLIANYEDLSLLRDQIVYNLGADIGKTAARLYERFILPQTNVPITALPSTSPANAAFSLDDLCERWRIICTL